MSTLTGMHDETIAHYSKLTKVIREPAKGDRSDRQAAARLSTIVDVIDRFVYRVFVTYV